MKKNNDNTYVVDLTGIIGTFETLNVANIYPFYSSDEPLYHMFSIIWSGVFFSSGIYWHRLPRRWVYGACWELEAQEKEVISSSKWAIWLLMAIVLLSRRSYGPTTYPNETTSDINMHKVVSPPPTPTPTPPFVSLSQVPLHSRFWNGRQNLSKIETLLYFGYLSLFCIFFFCLVVFFIPLGSLIWIIFGFLILLVSNY